MTDPWIRFDMWAERAHEAARAAVAAEERRGLAEDMTGGLTDANSRAADIYRDLAVACRPQHGEVDDPTPESIDDHDTADLTP